METLILYVYQETLDPEIEQLLQGLHNEQTFEIMNENVVKLTAKIDPYEPLDYYEIYALMLSDFEVPVTFIIMLDSLHNMLNVELILNYIQKLPKTYYDGEDILLSLIKRFPETMPLLQKALNKHLEKSLIETTLAIADANMNLSIAAKNLYMHRNTLHYRIEKVIDKTGINIKTFKGLSIFSLLFRH